MLKKIVVFTLLFTSTQVSAAFNECVGVYVGRISITNQGMDKVVIIQNTDSLSGSYWVNFSGWEANAKKEALSILMTAKVSKHRVDIYTTASDQCSIGTPGQTFKEIHLSTNS